MIVKHFVDEGLGNSSYLVASEQGGVAAVIDPQRDVDRYIKAAEELGVKIIYALETHVHNDYVSGGRELAALVEAKWAVSSTSKLLVEHIPLNDGSTLPLGDLVIRVISTPGHTPEHITFAIGKADSETPEALFTGGALTVGGAARTDLLGRNQAEDLARKLYHSIHDRLLRFDDNLKVYPTHGAGSFCTTPKVTERVTTIGKERERNPLVRAESEEEFVTLALQNLPSYPKYFEEMPFINRGGPYVLGSVPSPRALNPQQVEMQLNWGTLILDTRSPAKFAAGHIPNSLGVPLDAPLATWVGWVVPFNSKLVLITEDAAKLDQAVRALIRIGYEDLRGYLEGGMPAWIAAKKSIQTLPLLTAPQLEQQIKEEKEREAQRQALMEEARKLEEQAAAEQAEKEQQAKSEPPHKPKEQPKAGQPAKAAQPQISAELKAAQDQVAAKLAQLPPALVVLDVRSQAEWEAGHIESAINIEAGDLPARSAELLKEAPIVVYCHTGDRSTVAASLLQRQGFQKVARLDGGIVAWEHAGLPTVREERAPEENAPEESAPAV